MPCEAKIGSRLNLEVEYRDPETQELVDPDGVVFFAKPPSGPRRTILAEYKSLGVFEATLVIDAEGTWIVGAYSKGQYQDPVEEKVFVGEQLVRR
jgi:hypothetical protein